MEFIKRYDQGLRLVVKNIPGMMSVAAGIYAGVGSCQEDESTSGISHFIEHMMFKGTPTRSAFEIAESIDSMGAMINAFTTKEMTCYYTKSTAEHFEGCMEILSDLVFHSVFPEDELTREKGVVLEEISMVEDTPDELCSDLLSQAVYGNTSLGRPILGSTGNVKKFSREDLTNYIHTFYNAENLVVAVAGHIEFDEACKVVEKFILPELQNPAFQPKALLHVDLVQNMKQKKKEIEQANLCIAYPGLPFDDNLTNEYSLLCGAFGGGMTSRLFQTIRERKGLAYSVYAYTNAYRSNGTLVIYAGINPKNTDECVKTIVDECEKFMDKGITVKEFERGREQMKSSLVFGQENTATIMNAYGKYLLMTDKLLSLEEKIKLMDKLDYDKVNALCKNFFSSNQVCAAFVGNTAYSKNIMKLLTTKESV